MFLLHPKTPHSMFFQSREGSLAVVIKQPCQQMRCHGLCLYFTSMCKNLWLSCDTPRAGVCGSSGPAASPSATHWNYGASNNRAWQEPQATRTFIQKLFLCVVKREGLHIDGRVQRYSCFLVSNINWMGCDLQWSLHVGTWMCYVWEGLTVPLTSSYPSSSFSCSVLVKSCFSFPFFFFLLVIRLSWFKWQFVLWS